MNPNPNDVQIDQEIEARRNDEEFLDCLGTYLEQSRVAEAAASNDVFQFSDKQYAQQCIKLIEMIAKDYLILGPTALTTFRRLNGKGYVPRPEVRNDKGLGI